MTTGQKNLPSKVRIAVFLESFYVKVDALKRTEKIFGLGEQNKVK